MITYENMIERLCGKEYTSVGKSVWGRNLYCYKVGSGDKRLFINAAHHGNEYITSEIAMDFYDYIKDKCRGWEIYVMPMVNPDSVAISQGMIPKNTKTFERLKILNSLRPLSGIWRKNAEGVDLNHNYDACFSKEGVCGGKYPESEPETRAVARLVKEKNFNMVICLHSQGEEIYHGFRGIYPEGSLDIAKAMAEESGYVIAEPEGTATFGGMKDWFCDKFSRPGFTIEVGKGKNPLADEALKEIEERIFPAIYKGMLTYDEVLC